MLLIVGECLVMSPGQPSGAPAIAAWVAARLGAEVTFVGGVGADRNGALLRSALEAAGVRPALVTLPGLRTASASVEYHADGSRAFRFDVAGTAATAVQPADLGELPARATWVHVSGSGVLFGGTTADAVVAAVEQGRASGAMVSVDPNLRAELADREQRGILRDLCLRADVLFPTEDELLDLDLHEDDLVARGTVVCRTMAGDGARLRAGAIDVHVPAVLGPHEVVDPDGAGDTFAAAAIVSRMRGADWVDALGTASRVVAVAIAVEGPMSAPLTPADLD